MRVRGPVDTGAGRGMVASTRRHIGLSAISGGRRARWLERNDRGVASAVKVGPPTRDRANRLSSRLTGCRAGLGVELADVVDVAGQELGQLLLDSFGVLE